MAKYTAIKGDKARRYINEETGDIISRRQFLNIRHLGLGSLEQRAKQARSSNLELALSRPARGRKSLLKVEGEEKQFIIQARIEAEKREREKKQEIKTLKAFEREAKKQLNKRIHVKKLSLGLLKPGAKGFRISFNTYEDYESLYRQMRHIGVRKIIAYGLGMVGFDENTNEPRGITVFRMYRNEEPIIPRKIFEERMEEERRERLYFVFQHYFMHFAVAVKYIPVLMEERAKRKVAYAKRKAKRKAK